MPSQKQICLNIMLCQMTAILSAVAMLYLAASVVIPSLKELSFNFNHDPIMCTTINTVDTFREEKKIPKDAKKVDVKCESFTCNEWCLSTPSSSCVQITVMPRKNGSDIDFLGCEEIYDKSCSAMNITKSRVYNCKTSECAELRGTYNCSKGDIEYNPCTEISPAYDCSKGTLNQKEESKCDSIKCLPRLDGVYFCAEGKCTPLKGIRTYKDCKRKCSDLSLGSKNVLMFSKERLVTAKCSRTSSSNEEIAKLNANSAWKNANQVLILFCTYITNMEGKLHTGDCFNATLDSSGSVRSIKTYLELIKHSEALYSKNVNPFLIEPEESLRIMNDTLLRINGAGCVNTLKSECKAFFSTHAVDGSDGRTPDRYRCFYSNKTSDFVLGKYNERKNYVHLLVASVIPGTLFVISCICLFVCSKVVGIDDTGHLKVGLLQNEEKMDRKEL